MGLLQQPPEMFISPFHCAREEPMRRIHFRHHGRLREPKLRTSDTFSCCIAPGP